LCQAGPDANPLLNQLVAMSRELVNAALRYAELGYRVFPCVPGAKIPLTGHGFHDASTDLQQIESWWAQHPEANVGIRTEGLVVIDVDGAGNAWLTNNTERVLSLAAVPTSQTPRGGQHFFFRQPAGKNWRNTIGRLAPNVDTRANGGYIIATPSVGAEGNTYRWFSGRELNVPLEQLAEPPAWLVEELDLLSNRSAATNSNIPPRAALNSNPIPTGQRNGTLARLGGNMRRVGMTQAEIAAALHQVNSDRCTPPLEEDEVELIATSVARYEPDQVAMAVAENHWAQMQAESVAEEAAGSVDPGPTPEELLQVPGFISDVMSFTTMTAPYPDQALSFCGALSLQALLAGRKIRDSFDNRTNVYLLGLANSGAGKEHPRKVNQRVLLDIGMSACLGDMFASGEGIEDRLLAQPTVLFQTDEIDGLMTKINLGRDARHEGIMSVLLKMFTSASSLYPMRVKAGREPQIIDQPCLCIFGTAIPKHYYEALSLKMLTNGFFARMLILETGRRGQGQDAEVRDLPESVRATARWWAEYQGQRPGNMADQHPMPRAVEHTAEASALVRGFREQADREYSDAEARGDAAGMAIWARANEKAHRLALIYACSACHTAPQITPDAVRWACQFAEHQTRRMLFMASAHVAENEFDAKCKKLQGTLRRWRDQHGDAWMPFWQINRKHPWSEREHEEVRATLLNQRRIEYAETSTGGRPSRTYRLLGTS